MAKVIYLEMEDKITYYEVYNKQENILRILLSIIRNDYVSYLEKEFLQHLRTPKTV